MDDSSSSGIQSESNVSTDSNEARVVVGCLFIRSVCVSHENGFAPALLQRRIGRLFSAVTHNRALAHLFAAGCCPGSMEMPSKTLAIHDAYSVCYKSVSAQAIVSIPHKQKKNYSQA
jgi:hypothetical protein